jgi:putative protease
LKELLSPVGNMEALKTAVYAGADAVYLGGKKFGARAFADNFNEEEMKEAIFFCHLYGVKIYVTVNIMVYESELSDVLDYLKFLYENHVDAVIMADLGLMEVTHQKFPNLEIHASTQAHTHNIAQISFLKKLGVKRVVLARELSLQEIEKFPNDLELEVFIHGALCISYSGQCLFSSFLLNRSGNRGECAQICRLPFRLLKNGKPVLEKESYLLSTKDLNTTYRVSELLQSKISSFKIEGRMKSPAYVGYITKMYRRLIDDSSLKVTKQEEQNTAVLFSRGFTEGALFQAVGKDFIHSKTSNHQGIYLGDIEGITFQKIKIRLKIDLNQEDGIRFVNEDKGMIVNFLYNEKGLLISHAKAGETVFVSNKLGIQKKGIVMKTLDHSLELEMQNMSASKIFIDMQAKVNLDGFRLSLSDGICQVTMWEQIVYPAKQCPVSEDVIRKQLCKLGNTPFQVRNFELELDSNLYVNIKDVNDIRRKAVEAFTAKRVYRPAVQFGNIVEISRKFDKKMALFATVRNEEQLQVLLHYPVDGIYVEDVSLYQKYANYPVILRTNRVNHHVNILNVPEILAGESGTFSKFKGVKYTDYYFNVANHFTADLLVKNGASRVTLSPELSFDNITDLLQHYSEGNPFELILYGKIEVMVLNHCLVNPNGKSKECRMCRTKDHYALQDRNGAIYPLIMDNSHLTHIFYHRPLNLFSDFFRYWDLGIRKFRFEFLDESSDEVEKIVNQFLVLYNDAVKRM